MIHRIYCILFFLEIFLVTYGQDTKSLLLSDPDDIIPKPVRCNLYDGHFTMEKGMAYFIDYPDNDYCMKTGLNKDISNLNAEIVSLPFGLTMVENCKDADIFITIGQRKDVAGMMSDEAYVLKIGQSRIDINAMTATGAFYALQSIVQMAEKSRNIKCCMIYDCPRFGYRGLHFDVSRHFRTKEFLMKQMDAMALVKLNRMHLHLTDGAGWRIEIESYPRLTEFAAWRPYRKWSDWWSSERNYCESGTVGAYGGYYTKKDIKEILEYADRKHIEVIPEIEMPGHSDEVIAAYPELSCDGRQYGNCDLCPGKEETYEFMENVLEEVMALFPSEYVHIGGDEASKERWKTCPDCKRRMQEECLADVDELQSYFIHRIERFVNSHGKKIIGWDEIMQGGLAPNATVMSWQGTEAGISAAKAGHDVIMTPNAYCYLNYTQDAPFKEPESIGGYVTLDKVYSYDPVESGIDKDAASHIIGIQGNLWAEYLPDDCMAEYMYYPRAFAIAETGWSKEENKDFGNFKNRTLGLLQLLRGKGYKTFDLENEYGERKESLNPIKHLAVGAAVDYSIRYDSKYPATGKEALADGLLGGWSYGDGRWQGFLTDVDVTVDLGEVKPVHYIGATFMQIISAWVYMPEEVRISVSTDGGTFSHVGTVFRDFPATVDGLYFKTYGLVCDESCRYIYFQAVRPQIDGAWLFTDEIVIN